MQTRLKLPEDFARRDNVWLGGIDTTKKIIKIGSRKSRLAVIQTNIVAQTLRQNHPELEIEIVTMDTTGDLILDQPLDTVGGKGLFTLELEQALRSGKIDLSVHSLKDMPEILPEDLPVLAYSKREDPRDALVLPAGKPYNGIKSLLALTKPVGCSSGRRTVQLLGMCPGISISSVRGNVPTRLRKLDSGNYGALVLAAAGLNRLGLGDRVSYTFSAEEMLPAAGQGILAVQGRRDFDKKLIACVDDPDGHTAALAERAVISGLGCGCSSPAAAFCRIHDNEVCISAFYVNPDTGKQASGSVAGAREDIMHIASVLSKRLLKETGNNG